MGNHQSSYKLINFRINEISIDQERLPVNKGSLSSWTGQILKYLSLASGYTAYRKVLLGTTGRI